MNKVCIRRAAVLLLVLLTLLQAVPALAETQEDVRVITVSVKKLTLSPEETCTLTVSAKDGEPLSAYILQWESSAPDIVTVDSRGTLSALKKGSAKITVSSTDGSTDSSTCRVSVKEIESTPIKATLEGNIYSYNYNHVNSDTEKKVREYCERLGSSRVEKMLRKAVELVGTSYSKLDCSQLAQKVYKYRGISLPRVSDEQAEAMLKYKRESGTPELGDLCFMKFPSSKNCPCGTTCRRYMKVHHTAIYLGNIDGTNYVVDSSSTFGCVIIRGFSGNTIAGMPVVFYAGK